MGEFMKLRPTPFALDPTIPLKLMTGSRLLKESWKLLTPRPLINSPEQDRPGGKVTVKLTESKLHGKDSWKTSANIMFRSRERSQGEEFRKPKRNTMTMQEYIEKFTTLSRYAPEEVNTDPKKCKCFIRGPNPEIKSIVHSNEAPSFATPINRVIRIEEDKREEKSQLKRKFMEIKSRRQNAVSVEELWWASVTGLVWCAPRNTISNPSRFAPTQSSYRTRQHDPRTCFKCGKPGHFRFKLSSTDATSGIHLLQLGKWAKTDRCYREPSYDEYSVRQATPATG
ncbi:hypothetical protein U9M48_029003 [Paspalum notatum var. saurae]|uniref:CCHC-type domain-containing protein n=1 Tax=Paspalum notatum var. saurae TaxID=547442 RepID=A0AAQ3TYG4_PASNO